MTAGQVVDWLRRIDDARSELATLAARTDGAVTQPDDQTGERWTGRQVLAHLVEFIPYWLYQAEIMIAADDREVQVGRPKTDPDRLEGVRLDGPAVAADNLIESVLDSLDAVAAFLAPLQDRELDAVATHFRRGQMTVRDLLGTFVVDHIDEHVDQLRRAIPSSDGPSW